MADRHENLVVLTLNDQRSEVEGGSRGGGTVNFKLAQAHCHQPDVQSTRLPIAGFVVCFQLEDLGCVAGT